MNVVIDGIRYHVEKEGEGFPLLLLHGFTGDSSTWTSFCPTWGKHSTLIFPDIIGHGKTDSPDKGDRYQIESVANDLKIILDKIGVNQVDILGYSMGGRLALTFAILFPDRIRKLILASASPGLLTEQERESRRMKDKELAEFIQEAGIKPFVDYWEAIPLFSTMHRLSLTVKETIRNQRLRNSPSGLANSLLGMGTGTQPSWWENLSKITNAVLLVTGEEDAKFCDIAQKMLEKLQNGTWIALNNSGHALHVEEPEKFGTIVSDFLSN
ncbi:2-succinyl-6-hydroxy-2,4-cyclohexadiene-1-carboxylate synthase [Neobacillus ginsengisoli]|uniref:Putative 2-succinyl-6-hydroxy-2,4-cyclohexadiene-1-carboxylate synthase n=1 Tax=Neobacillus ginsengisoli TaxID=904295 RepID=A0ABT9XPI8_9BACI|nr:2-succinyl-6-hydroxy-2,4-cyclohexadiene-1-carboxylate synthase [Neobacillus ginsengisoli]MDQ0196904.1 2-succinyl-6-hydroxy-2,4-cyclohexadiene-1-carboxylate synthase [Neobacillus ginsengisoli]